MGQFYLRGAPERLKALVVRKVFPSPLKKVKTLFSTKTDKSRVKTAHQRDTEKEQKTQYLEDEEEVQPSPQQQEEEEKAVLMPPVSLCQKEELEKQKIPESATQQQRVQ